MLTHDSSWIKTFVWYSFVSLWQGLICSFCKRATGLWICLDHSTVCNLRKNRPQKCIKSPCFSIFHLRKNLCYTEYMERERETEVFMVDIDQIEVFYWSTSSRLSFSTGRRRPDWAFLLVDVDQTELFYWSTSWSMVDVHFTDFFITPFPHFVTIFFGENVNATFVLFFFHFLQNFFFFYWQPFLINDPVIQTFIHLGVETLITLQTKLYKTGN